VVCVGTLLCYSLSVARVANQKMNNMLKPITAAFLALALLTLAQDTKPEVAQAVRGAVKLQDQMRDPDSFVVEKVFTMTNKATVVITCFEYRARNGFGGMDRDAALYTEYQGKPHVDTRGLYTESGRCPVTKRYPFVDITKEFKAAREAASGAVRPTK
jgi:hypothetical protein